MCGICHEATQRRPFSEKDLTYGQAMELTQGMEAADRNSKAFKVPEPAIKKVSYQHPKSREAQNAKACHRCIKSNHNSEHCKSVNAECQRCGKVGHIAPLCRTQLSDSNRQSTHMVRNSCVTITRYYTRQRH